MRMSNNTKPPFPTTKSQAEAWIPFLTDNLLEIAENRRIGIPTLCYDVAEERAAGMLTNGQVNWRMRKAGKKVPTRSIIITDIFDSRECVRL
jgi:hypothetical protein